VVFRTTTFSPQQTTSPELIQPIDDLHEAHHAGVIAARCEISHVLNDPIHRAIAVDAVDRQRLRPSFLIEHDFCH
jgi:hypothetical protein